MKDVNGGELVCFWVVFEKYVDLYWGKIERFFDDYEMNVYFFFDVIFEKGILDFLVVNIVCMYCDWLFLREEFSII